MYNTTPVTLTISLVKSTTTYCINDGEQVILDTYGIISVSLSYFSFFTCAFQYLKPKYATVFNN